MDWHGMLFWNVCVCVQPMPKQKTLLRIHGHHHNGRGYQYHGVDLEGRECVVPVKAIPRCCRVSYCCTALLYFAYRFLRAFLSNATHSAKICVPPAPSTR